MAPYYFEEELLLGILTGLASSIPSMLFGIATYVLSALGLYTISKRRGLNKPWLAWIPVVNCYLLGSLSDQYRYVVKGENKSKRKWLLGLSITAAVLTTAVMVMAIIGVVSVAGDMMYGVTVTGDTYDLIFGILGASLPLTAASIAYAVIYYMALYDVYKSLDPSNCVVFLVLSILFSVTEPFFLFFNRNKDGGMPPRKQEQPVYATYAQSQPETQPSWESDHKDYL